jgi:hypothetical protein
VKVGVEAGKGATVKQALSIVIWVKVENLKNEEGPLLTVGADHIQIVANEAT